MNLRVKERYIAIVPELKTAFGLKNEMAVPKITKIVVNAGFGRLAGDDKAIKDIADDLTRITGQKPLLNKAKKAVAGFKLRENQVIGASVTLRGAHMYEFLDRLISVVFPRSRDFRGLSRSTFANGSYSVGIREHTAFPEIAELGKNPIPLQVTIVTNTKNTERARDLLIALGMPFKKVEED